MARHILIFLTVVFALIAGCAARESSLIGKWQSQAEQSAARKSARPLEVQFEFFKDGTVVENEQVLGKWMQSGTGSYSFIDPNHLKIDFGPLIGATVYETESPDNDHLKLQAGDRAIRLMRVR